VSRFLTIAREIGELVEHKNAAYGSSFAKAGAFLRLLYPEGLAPEQYGDALLLVRIFDKLQRIATDRDALGESPYRDIAGYGILGAALHQGENGGSGIRTAVSEAGLHERGAASAGSLLQRPVPAEGPAGGAGTAKDVPALRTPAGSPRPAAGLKEQSEAGVSYGAC
jgi:hypothetical protein